MRLLVFGKSGQIARELAANLPNDMSAVFLARDQTDLMQPQACFQSVLDADADAVINAAAWTGVDQAESRERSAMIINGDAPGAMAKACRRKNIPLLHLSSDYVFDGQGLQPHAPENQPSPLNAYGRTKLAGEKAIRDSGAIHLILRTSWVFSTHGSNFVKSIVARGSQQSRISVVSDQIGGPTPAKSVALALFSAARALNSGHPGGTHHFSGTPDTSRADFARTILRAARVSCLIDDIPSPVSPTHVRRPQNSRLDCSGFAREFGTNRPDWHAGVLETLSDLGSLR